MPTVGLLRRITSTRYIFLLSGLVFVLWSLVVSVVPKSSTFSALFRMDLDQSTTTETFLPNSLNTRPHLIIYVISLANRKDRREQMEFLRTFQDLTWTIVDAVPANATLVDRILNRVALLRAERKRNGTTTRFHWPEEINALSVSLSTPLNPSGSDTWTETETSTAHPDLKSLHSGTSDAGNHARLPCASEDDLVPTIAKNDRPEWTVLSPAKIACWHSHVSVIRRFVEGQDAHGQRREDDVAILLEDDIDMEKDISTRLSQVWSFLPAGWDIVFLGHCWSDESHYPPLMEFKDTCVHPSHYPKCTHAYALSLSGARRLLQHLRYPPFAYSRALDQAYAWLVQSGRLRSYSIVPSLVVQRKSGKSDISPGSGSEWREHLQDGVFEVVSQS